MAWTKRQQYAVATTVVVILLIAFLWYYFRSKKKGEKCPDGRNIPDGRNGTTAGDCTTNPPVLDSEGQVVVQPLPTPDANGCVPPSKYITNAFPLALGMKGDFVIQLQVALNVQFKAGLKEDGYFGCNTLNAMKKAWNIESMDLEFFKDKIQGTITMTTT